MTDGEELPCEEDESPVVLCDVCGKDVEDVFEAAAVAHPDPDIPLLAIVHQECRPELVEGPVLGACGTCWMPMELDGPKAHDCGGERVTWRASTAMFVVHHPALPDPLVGRCLYPMDPLMVPTYVRRAYNAFRSSKFQVPVMETVKDHSERDPRARPVAIDWNIEPEVSPPASILPAPDRVCPECRRDRPDYKGQDDHALTCSHCGSTRTPVPR